MAQNPVSHNYTTLNGLPSNTVYYTLQDSKGYMWFATDKGIVRFNGKEFKVFTTIDGLSDNEFFDIYEDSKHRIWFTSFNGEPTFYENGIFYSSQNCSFLQGHEFKGPAFKVLEDKNGDLFYLTFYEIYKISKKNKVEKLHINATVFSSLFKDNNNNVCALTANDSKINKIYNLSENTVIHSNHLSNIQINSKSYFDENFVLYNVDTTIYVARPGQRSPQRITVSAGKNYIQSINKISGEYWVGTARGIFVSRDFDFQHAKKLFQGFSISSCTKDFENNIWVTTIGNGILFIPNIEINEIDEKVFPDFISAYSYSELSDKRFAVGFQNRNFLLGGKNGLQMKKLSLNYGLGFVTKVLEYDKRIFVAGGSSFDVFDLDGNHQKEIPTPIKDFIIVNDSIWHVGGGGVIHAPLYKFMNLDRLSTAELKSFVEVRIKGKGIKKIKNDIVVYGLFGIKKIKNRELYPFHPSKLLSKNITDVETSNDGKIWMTSTVNGLLLLYKGKVQQFGSADGLPTNYINAVFVENKNVIWLATLKGLVRVNAKVRKGKVFIHCTTYTSFHGLSSDEINDVYCSGNMLHVLSSGGYCYLDKQVLNKKSTRPNLCFERLLVQSKQIPYKAKMVLAAGQNEIKLFYQGFSYKSFGKIRYKYLFEGIDDEWSYTQQNKLEIPYLEHGKYRLQIIAIDTNNEPSLPLIIEFEILPHFYETWWFLLLMYAILGFLIYSFIKSRVTRIRTNHKLRERILKLENDQLKSQNSEMLLQKEFTELEQKALMLQMNPHFIFNSINSIQGLYQKNKEKADEYLILFSNLLRQILEFSQKKTITLEQEIQFLKNYLLINQVRFENNYEFHFELHEQIHPSNIEIVPLILQPFVENALIHGIQTLKETGKITIRFTMQEDFLVCEIEDNGIGREKSKLLQKNKIHQSLGMQITERRLNFFNNRESSIEIEDLKNEYGLACGTLIRVYLALDEY